MRVWVATLLLATVTVSITATTGCRRDNPARLRATDFESDSIGGTSLTDGGSTDGTTGVDMSGSESGGEVPFEERICRFNFGYETNLTSFFPGLGVNCGIEETYYLRRYMDDSIELFDDSGCVSSKGSTNFHKILVGNIPLDTCVEVKHGTHINSNSNCETSYAVVRETNQDTPLLAFSREDKVPEPLKGTSFEVAKQRTQTCGCSTDPKSGTYTPSCCEDLVVRNEMLFTIEGVTHPLLPGEETTVTYEGKSYRMRLFASEEPSPDVVDAVPCFELGMGADPSYWTPNIAWLLD